jgi:hypothetical protein
MSRKFLTALILGAMLLPMALQQQAQAQDDYWYWHDRGLHNGWYNRHWNHFRDDDWRWRRNHYRWWRNENPWDREYREHVRMY